MNRIAIVLVLGCVGFVGSEMMGFDLFTTNATYNKKIKSEGNQTEAEITKSTRSIGLIKPALDESEKKGTVDFVKEDTIRRLNKKEVEIKGLHQYIVSIHHEHKATVNRMNEKDLEITKLKDQLQLVQEQLKALQKK